MRRMTEGSRKMSWMAPAIRMWVWQRKREWEREEFIPAADKHGEWERESELSKGRDSCESRTRLAIN